MAHILLVDDEPDIAFTTQKGLTAAGFEVSAFTDPLTALASFKPGIYDLLILDVKMPKMDGFTLYSKMRERDPNARVCFLTAFGAEYYNQFRARWPEIDVKCFMQKPLSSKAILSVIRSELNQTC